MSPLARLSSTLAAGTLALGLAVAPTLARDMGAPGDLSPRTLNRLSLDGLMPAPEPILDPLDGPPSVAPAAAQTAA